MPNRSYQKGYRFEARVRKHYQKLGYHVVRSYASKGAADLYCMKECRNCSACVNTELLLVQCKNYDTTKRKFNKQETDALLTLAKKTGGTAVLVSNIKHKIHTARFTKYL